MEETRLHEFDRRLTALEQLWQGLDARLSVLESRGYIPSRTYTGPPPVQQQRAQPQERPYVPPGVAPMQAPAAEPPKPPEPAKTLSEYQIGAQILPRLGAVVFLLGLAFFVSWGFSNGIITPAMLFGGAVALCLAFIGFGQWKRSEKEEFGHILTGVGSCGLYLTFAAGHIFQNLFSGETLVGLFLALSFVNLAYSYFVQSRSFLAIGLIGGLGAALMPLQRENFELNLLLHFAIILPAAVVAGARRWADAAAWLWLLSSFALVPALDSSLPWELRTGALYLNSLLCLGAFVRQSSERLAGLENLFVPLVAWTAALGGLAIRNDAYAIAHVGIFGVGLGAISLLSSEHRNRLLLCAGGVVLTVAPWGLSHAWSAVAFCILSIALSGYGVLRRGQPYVAAASVVQLALGVLAYVLAESTTGAMSFGMEAPLLLLLLAATSMAAWAAVNSGAPKEPAFVAASVASFPFFAVLVQTTLGLPRVGTSLPFSLTLAGLMFSGIMVSVALSMRFLGGTVLAWLAALFSAIGYFFTLDQARPGSIAESLFLLAYGAMILTASIAAGRTAPKDLALGSRVVATLVNGFLFMRLIDLILGAGNFQGPSIVEAALAVAALAALIGTWRRWPEVVWTSWTFFGVAAFMFLDAMLQSPLLYSHEVLTLGLATAVLVVLTLTSLKFAQDERPLLAVAGALGWMIFARLGLVALTLPEIGFQRHPAGTSGWIVYALILLTLGFIYERPTLRYVSLCVMFCASVKVLVLDLGTASQGVRVAVLMALGLLMLGGGYGYIRHQARKQMEAPKSP